MSNKKSRFGIFGRKAKSSALESNHPDATNASVRELFPEKAAIPHKIPHTLLTLTLDQKLEISAQQAMELQRILESLPPIEVGEVNIFPIEAGHLPSGGYYVKTFIRNGGDLSLDLSVNAITLFLVDASGEKVAGGVFRPENFESIKFGESRYWTFAWRTEEVLKPHADLSTYSLAFQ